MNAELKPCPFCGGTASAWQSRQFSKRHIIGSEVYVYCGRCNARTALYDSEREAISAWNKRISEVRT